MTTASTFHPNRGQKKTVLVTGGTGFLGAHLLPALVAAGYKVRAVVRPTSDTTQIDRLGCEAVVVPDITAYDPILAACEGCDAVIHAAGKFRFWGDRETFYQTNLEGSRNLIECAVSAGVARFVHVSTIAVIGETPHSGVIDESTPCRPLDAYMASKLAAEEVVLQAAADVKSTEVLVVRPGAFYGPGGRYAFNRLFFEEPLFGWRIRVSRGRHVQFPVYVPDVARGILLTLEKGNAGQIYNISGRSITHNEANQVISRLAGIGPFRLNMPKPLVLGLAHGWTWLARLTQREPFYPINLKAYVFQDWPVSIAKAERELGFSPTRFEVGAWHTLKWYQERGIFRLPGLAEPVEGGEGPALNE